MTPLCPSHTPILILTWRRPDKLHRLLASLRPLQPKYLYFSSDGPKSPNDKELVLECRKLISNHVDWPCSISTLFFNENQGLRLAVSSAITWFFSFVDHGIILEEDCIPDPSFFPYCTELLSLYRDDLRVWSITGSNFQDSHPSISSSYYFSRYAHCWGWATWSNRWRHYSNNMANWDVACNQNLFDDIFLDKYERYYWIPLLSQLFQKSQPDSWAYRWLFTCLFYGGLSVNPRTNLVDNIGFDSAATHTKVSSHNQPSLIPLQFPLNHPTAILPSKSLDRYTFLNHYGGKSHIGFKATLRRLYNLILASFNKYHNPS